MPGEVTSLPEAVVKDHGAEYAPVPPVFFALTRQ
jgi:hypothetical protein